MGQIETIELLRKIEANTRPQQEFAITVTSPPGPQTDSFETFFPQPVRASSGRHLEMALIGFHTAYSWTNVKVGNNTFVYSSDGGTTFKTITLPEGNYELDSINTEVQRQIVASGDADDKANPITISPNHATLRAIIDISNPDFQVDIAKSGLRTILGWPADAPVLKAGRHEAPEIVKISSINEVLIHCDAVDGSYTATSTASQAKKSYVLASFYPDVPPGFKIGYSPSHLVFLPLIVDQVQRMRIWITDQDNNPINMRGELITVSLQLRDHP